MRAEPAMEFRLSLGNPSGQCLADLLNLLVPEEELRRYILRSLGIKKGDLLVCVRLGERYYVIRRPSKKERLNRSREPILVTRERTQYFAELGNDFHVDQADFSKFAF